jgi:tRNA-binding protein
MAYYFYNKEGIGDVLLVRLIKNGKTVKTKDISQIVTILYNEQDQVIGYNFFNVSKQVNLEYSGRIMNPKKDEELMKFIDESNAFLRLRDKNLPLLDFEENSGFVVGKVISCVDHPSSNHLHVCKVDVGSEVLPIVCGASNVSENAKVVVATINAVMNDGSVISEGSLLGEISKGMLCSKRELGLTKSTERTGLLLLDDSFEIGKDFFLG